MKTPRIRHARHRAFDGAERGSAGIKRLQRHNLFLANRAANASSGGIGDTAATDEFTASGATLTATAHGFETGEGPFVVSNAGGALPDGLVAGTSYWLRRLDADTFQLHLSRRDAGLNLGAVTTGDAGTGTHSFALAADRDAFNDYLREGVEARALRALTDVDSVVNFL